MSWAKWNLNVQKLFNIEHRFLRTITEGRFLLLFPCLWTSHVHCMLEQTDPWSDPTLFWFSYEFSQPRVELLCTDLAVMCCLSRRIWLMSRNSVTFSFPMNWPYLIKCVSLGTYYTRWVAGMKIKLINNCHGGELAHACHAPHHWSVQTISRCQLWKHKAQQCYICP